METEKRTKHIFHASKVDRIAIVDRPAVPDAEILVFKREGVQDENASKGFNFQNEFALASVGAATQVLEGGFWRTMYDSELSLEDKRGLFKGIMKEFVKAVIGLAEQVESSQGVSKADGPTVGELVDNFKRGLSIVAIYEGFTFFKNAVGNILYSLDYYKNAPALLKGIAGQFEEFILERLEQVVATKSLTEEKIGRKISDARLKKLQAALNTLNEILGEVTTSEDVDKRREEEQTMELKEIQEMIEKSLTPILEQIGAFKTVLEEKGILEKEMTPEEKAQKEEAEKKEKEEAEKKLKEEADAKAEAEKKVQDEAEKREAEIKELKEKASKVEAMETELSALKAKYEKFDKSLQSFEKRTGVKVSLDVDGEPQEKSKKDPFAEAMKG